MIHPSAMFNYVAIVPDLSNDGTFEVSAIWRRSYLEPGEEPVSEALLSVTDAGLTPNPGFSRPRVMRSCITITPKNKDEYGASFHIDRALTNRMRAGDSLNVVRTGCGGIGLSVVRGNELIVAVGAVTEVQLGDGVTAVGTGDLIVRAEAIFRERDPSFSFSEWPIEIMIGESRSILTCGNNRIGEYEISVEHGSILGFPGIDESASICHSQLCSPAAARLSAKLLDLNDQVREL